MEFEFPSDDDDDGKSFRFREFFYQVRQALDAKTLISCIHSFASNCN